MYDGARIPSPEEGANGVTLQPETPAKEPEEEAGDQPKPVLVKKAHREILDHERKRRVELKCMELQEMMEEQGRLKVWNIHMHDGSLLSLAEVECSLLAVLGNRFHIDGDHIQQNAGDKGGYSEEEIKQKVETFRQMLMDKEGSECFLTEDEDHVEKTEYADGYEEHYDLGGEYYEHNSAAYDDCRAESSTSPRRDKKKKNSKKHKRDSSAYSPSPLFGFDSFLSGLFFSIHYGFACRVLHALHHRGLSNPRALVPLPSSSQAFASPHLRFAKQHAAFPKSPVTEDACGDVKPPSESTGRRSGRPRVREKTTHSPMHNSDSQRDPHTKTKNQKNGTIEAEVTTVTGVPPCLRVDTSTRPERKRAEVIAAVPGAAEDRPRELILENATLARANRHTCGRTTPESETALIIRMQREVAGDPAVTLPSGRDGETRPASWRLAESPDSHNNKCL
ncbi:Serine/arginine repetitive matrix protein 3 [Triplophysa tibetana]|uniref:Serine/arginine repetitive matrix protein 3 n=1 Tax=Triplophysa tibetana TaxID=1572043 RepID=A0A5A9P799_9TELE|nr:Serine/arginine repetitive matrix protein 3 [Triplophysa tibetana]